MFLIPADFHVDPLILKVLKQTKTEPSSFKLEFENGSIIQLSSVRFSGAKLRVRFTSKALQEIDTIIFSKYEGP